MSARMRRKRGRRHEEFARTFGCECKRHAGRDLAAEESRAALDTLRRHKDAREVGP